MTGSPPVDPSLQTPRTHERKQVLSQLLTASTATPHCCPSATILLYRITSRLLDSAFSGRQEEQSRQEHNFEDRGRLTALFAWDSTKGRPTTPHSCFAPNQEVVAIMAPADGMSAPGTATYSSGTMSVGDGTWDFTKNTFLLPNLVGLNFDTMQYNGERTSSD